LIFFRGATTTVLCGQGFFFNLPFVSGLEFWCFLPVFRSTFNVERLLTGFSSMCVTMDLGSWRFFPAFCFLWPPNLFPTAPTSPEVHGAPDVFSFGSPPPFRAYGRFGALGFRFCGRGRLWGAGAWHQARFVPPTIKVPRR